jgi:hypothetical protein
MPTTLTRSLLVVLIPGLVAIAPWLLALVQYTSATLGLDKYESLGYALIFSAAAVAGSILEGLASHLEVRWDRRLEEKFSVQENWYRYLSRTFDHEPVGYRYLSRMVTTLYFELSMLFAIPIFGSGAALLAALRFPRYQTVILICSIPLVIAAIFYFRWQAHCTHRVLCETRNELNRRLAS